MTNLIIFGAYLIMLVVIGYITFLRTKSYDDFTIAGRSNNKWITAISTESSDMSGWLLLGLPGMAYATGFGSIWLMIGLIFGTLFNWVVVANRLRTITEYYDAITLMEYFEKRLNDKKGVISLLSCIIIIVFMTVNASAEIIGSGKLLNAAFGFDYNVGIYIGLGIVLVYTFLGGFMAVSWSNLIQGSIMFITLLIVPIVALIKSGGFGNLTLNLLSQDPNFFSLTSGNQGFLPIFSLIMGGIGVGMCYPGMPHVITNYMAIKDPGELKASTLIAVIWVSLTSYGAAIIGIMGRAVFPNIEDPEQVFLPLTKALFPDKILGLFAAAVMAAILSSVSAYLLVAASSFASSLYRRFVKVEDENQLINVQRFAIVLISIAALIMSFSGGFVYKVALFASAGFGACFGPLVLFSLYSSKINSTGAIWSMIVGLVTILLWWNLGFSEWLYEMIPGFVLSTITIIVVSKLTGGPDKDTEEKYLNYLLEQKNNI